MKRFAIGFVVGLLVAALVGVIVVFAAMRIGGDRRCPSPTGRRWWCIWRANYPNKRPWNLPLPFLAQQQPMTMVETWQLFKQAAADSRIKAMVLEPRGLGVGWAKMQELHDDIWRSRNRASRCMRICAGQQRAIITSRPPRIASTWRRKMSWIQGSARGTDVLQDHAGQARRRNGVRARRQIQRRAGRIHAHLPHARRRWK